MKRPPSHEHTTAVNVGGVCERSPFINISHIGKIMYIKGAAGASNTDDPKEKNHNISIATI
jgi:hypothetical protein